MIKRAQKRALLMSALILVATLAAAKDQPKVSNNFTDTDIRLVLKEVAASSGVAIIADTSVKTTEISIEFKEESVEQCLTKLSLMVGFSFKKKGEMYIVSMATPESPLYNEFVVTKTYLPRTESAQSLAALVGKSFQQLVQTDKSANSLTITGTQSQVDSVLQALESIDRPRKQFVVEALVTEIQVDDSKSTGLSWNWHNFAVDGGGGLTYNSVPASDIATLKALIDEKKAVLKANPRITATDGKEATILVGNETYYQMVGGNAYAPQIQFQKVNTGIHLNVTGYVSPDGTINLHLKPEVSDAAAPVGGSPTTTIRQAETTMTVKSGSAIVLGGLTREFNTREETRVPILGSLPIIGNLFKSNSTVKHKTEIVIVIVPHILEEADNIAASQKIAHIFDPEKPGKKPLITPVPPAQPVTTSNSIGATAALPDDGLKPITKKIG